MGNVVEEVLEGYEPSPELLSVMDRSRPATLLALDVGTSGVRAALFDDSGNEVTGRPIRIDSRSNAWADSGAIAADALVEQVARAVDVLFVDAGDLSLDIQLIALSCFWHSLVGVDDSGRPTTPVIGWADGRAATASEKLRAENDEVAVHSRTGCRFHPSYWPAKLRQIRDDEPDVFRRTRRWLSFSDYLAEQFCGETGTSVSMASGTGLFNQRRCEWDVELINALRIEIDTLPEIFPSHRRFAGLLSAYVRRWPQLAGSRMFPAVSDGVANNIGAGCFTRDKIAIMIGTSGAMRVLFRGDPPDQIPSELWCYRADNQRVVVGGALSDGGSLFRWIRESWLPGEDAEWIENELQGLEPDAHGLTILPFWSGERSTGWHTHPTGAILGLTLQTHPIEILRAAMEAVAYRFALIAKALAPLTPSATIFASGHALRSSRVWTQILADVLGQPLHVSGQVEASTRGAALLALEAAGRITDIVDLANAVEAVFEPDMARHARYLAGLDRQQQWYDRMIV